MLTASLTVTGLVMNLAGVILLFRYGMPYRVRSEGLSYYVTETADKDKLAAERRYDLLGKLGLVLIVLGTLAQITATLEINVSKFLDVINFHPFLSALLISVIGGIPVTLAWSEFCHWINRKSHHDPKPDPRYRWLSFTFGVLERAMLTTLVLWLPTAVGGFAGAWLIVKSVVGWADFIKKQEEHEGRARFSVTLFGSLVSFLWAIGWGIWGMTVPLPR